MHTWPSISTETMELPLASVYDCEVRCVIRFLSALRETTAEIYCQISAVYGEECRMSKSMVCRYFSGKRFNATEEIKATVVEYFQNLDTEYLLVYKSYINDVRNVQICKEITWKNRELRHQSTVFFSIFLDQ